jgi:hypothetical protein
MEDGRKEILSIIKRKKYKEILVHKLEDKKLKKSEIPISFVVRDLLSRQILFQKESSYGKILYLKYNIDSF